MRNALIIFFIFFALSQTFAESVFTAEKYTLPNGLTVVLQSNHTFPYVVLDTWVRVGSKESEEGLTGFAHLFEHLLLKGGRVFPEKEFRRRIMFEGGYFNGQTYNDYTMYSIELPSKQYELAFQMDVDRLTSMNVSIDSLNIEREIVKEELKKTQENNPWGHLWALTIRNLFEGTPYEVSTIGTAEDLDRITPELANSFFSRYYAVNNLVLVLVGDFVPTEAKAMIDKYYGKLVPKEIQRKPLRFNFKDKEFSKPIQKFGDFSSAYRYFSFHAPEGQSRDRVAAIVFKHILKRRLENHLIHKLGVTDTLYVNYEDFWNGGMLYIGVQALSKTALKIIDAEIKQQIETIATQINSNDFRIGIAQAKSEWLQSMKVMRDRAWNLGYAEAVGGDYRKSTQYYKDVEALSIKDVSSLVRRYFTVDKSLMTGLLPETWRDK